MAGFLPDLPSVGSVKLQLDVSAMPETNLEPPSQPGLLNHVNVHGSQSAPFVQSMNDDLSGLNGTDIADIAHFLCVLHGRHPGVVDHAATRIAEPEARNWLVQAIEGFTAERAFITRLTVAAGPVSGVGANDQSNATVLGQRKALDMLSQSDRKGCALGASFALVIDWQSFRPQLEQIAIRLGVEPRPHILPSNQSTQALKSILSRSAQVERAISFGVDQILSQHRGLWQLLEARKNARAQD